MIITYMNGDETIYKQFSKDITNNNNNKIHITSCEWNNKSIDRQIDRQTNKQTDRQTDRQSQKL